MNDRLLTAFRVFLVAWGGIILAHFTYVQAKTDWGRRTLEFDAANPWDPTYYGVVYATAVLVPFLCFSLPIARRYGGMSSSIGRALIAFGTGLVLWGFGNCYWFIQNVRGVEAPYPSLADAGYLSMLPFAGWALLELSRVVGLTARDWRRLPLALAIAFPLNAYIMLPQGIGAGTFDTPLAAVISSTYVLSDVVLLGASILVALGARRAAGGRFFAPVLAVTATIALLYVGDLVFNFRIAQEYFYNADISDMLYGCFMVTGMSAAWLFLRADVRASEAVAAQQDDWTLELVGGPKDDGPQLPPIHELATAILRGQERVMGAQIAHGIASNVSGIEIDPSIGVVSAVDTIAIDALVREFRSIAGPLGEMACWTAARPVFTRHPDLVVASLARFRTDAPESGGVGGGSRVRAGVN
jgi:hypothetical protein